MSRLARRDTGPELALRRVLHGRGLRYRVHRRPVPEFPRQADLVFAGAKVAVFVDGCFWHGCPEHGRREHRTNAWYWPEKIRQNKARDQDTDARLVNDGWLSLRVWEHQEASSAADVVEAAVRSRTTAARRRRA